MVLQIILADILLVARIFPRPCGARKNTTQLVKYPRVLSLKPLNKVYVIYEFCLAQQKHDVWIAAVPEPCSTAELVELNWVPNLIQKFDSDAVLLPCFCRT